MDGSELLSVTAGGKSERSSSNQEGPGREGQEAISGRAASMEPGRTLRPDRGSQRCGRTPTKRRTGGCPHNPGLRKRAGARAGVGAGTGQKA